MQSAYTQASPPHEMHHRGSLPNINDGYRPAVSGAPQYAMPHNVPIAQHVQPAYDPYTMVSRAPQPEPSHAEDNGLATLAPGTAPQAMAPTAKAKTLDGRKYELHVVQQPRRARMCGFGDKDRRPITPPPCVRLIITDTATGKEVDCNEVEHGMFVLNVDLWDEKGLREVNLVRHSGSSPGISSGTPASYQEAPGVYSTIAPQQPFKVEPGQQGGYNPYPNQPQVNPYSNGQPPQYNSAPAYHQGYAQPTNGSAYPPQGYSQPQQQIYYTTAAAIHGGAAPPPPGAEYGSQHQLGYGNRQYTPADMGVQRTPVSSGQPQGMFTRNLIGSLAASAFRLTDPDDKIGIWFVLQDLSVRTEGTFRLRFSFVNVGVQNPPPGSVGSGKNVSTTAVNTGRAPVLASCFSESFTVYSAKRFPGVVESTHLSKCFATQGIKIPIRKDGPGKGDKDKDFEDD
ncbi:hypothetical protein EG329_000769 [Mollisiaceae sp. DMI_Dod_QoI]|nr:hypothetical protein EG329_000769 [Helotiales sp. DMI_Dod_QoI]